MSSQQLPPALPIGGVRIARPTDQLDKVIRFYRDGLGLPELGRFEGHAGYRGVMLGLPGMQCHLEFTQHDDGSPGPKPTRDNLLVLYFDDPTHIDSAVTRLARLGHKPVEAENPYWTEHGAVTVEDPDHWRVVLMPQLPGRPVDASTAIRPGVPADLPAVTEVFQNASLSDASYRENLLAHPEYLVLQPDGLAEGRTHVAERNGALVGFATWSEADGTYELEDLFVDPAWMRRGIATALVGRIAEVLRAQGVRRLEVTANPDALEFYRSAGFRDCGTADTVFGVAPRMVLHIGP